MPLTPSTVRQDKKCGASGIADSKKCRKGVLGAAGGRQRDAQRTLERRYGKSKPWNTERVLKTAGVVVGAAALGVGAGVVAHKLRNKNTTNLNNIPDLSNVRIPRKGKVNVKGSAEELIKKAEKSRLNELESLARGTNPALEAQLQVGKARNKQQKEELKSQLKGARSELNMLRTELGVWGPNRIKPFKRKPKTDSIWAQGFTP